MPPRLAKKSSGGSSAGKKTAARTAKGTPKAEIKVVEKEIPPVPVVKAKEEVRIKMEESKDFEIKEEEEEEEEEDNPIVDSRPTSTIELQDDAKEVYVEEDKGEQLELEDNEPEYEPDEEIVVDYGEREIEHDDGQEEGGECEEVGEEEDVGEEEEAEMVDEDIDDGTEDIEGEEDDDNVRDEHDVEEAERHEFVKERRKRKEFEVFVGGLDNDATEEDLKKVFSQVGEVTEVRLMMNPQTKKNKGFAFLRFATVEQAKRAVSELNKPVVRGKQCGVSPSEDSDTLFLGNICKTWSKERLKEKLKNYGVENIEDLTLVEDTNEEGKNRGFAFLEFSSRSEAMDAFRRLQKRDVVFGVDRPAKVSLADSYVEPDDEIMAQVKIVFIDGILPSWDEDRVKEYLKKFGVIEKVELARNMPAAKRKDFGFVTFDTHDSAVKCAESINNSEMGEDDHKVKVRARLSRPLQRGRGKGIVRGDYRYGRGDSRIARGAWGHPPPRRYPGRVSRPLVGRGVAVGGHGAALGGHGVKRPIGLRDRRLPVAALERPRRLPPPVRSYDRRPPIPAYTKSSSRRDYSRHDVLDPRSRVPVGYGHRHAPERRPSYREEYSSRESAYSDIPPRSAARTADRRPYAEDGYGRKLERPAPAYREGRDRDYDTISGSKRPYPGLDDAPRYADMSARHSRARLDYNVGGSGTQYDDVYSERLGRSHLGYSSRSSLSGQDSHGLYSSRQGMSYGGGSLSGNDVGGVYSSNFGSSYLSRGSDVGGGSYSSFYTDRSLNGSGYLSGSGSGPYY